MASLQIQFLAAIIVVDPHVCVARPTNHKLSLLLMQCHAREVVRCIDLFDELARYRTGEEERRLTSCDRDDSAFAVDFAAADGTYEVVFLEERAATDIEPANLVVVGGCD